MTHASGFSMRIHEIVVSPGTGEELTLSQRVRAGTVVCGPAVETPFVAPHPGGSYASAARSMRLAGRVKDSARASRVKYPKEWMLQDSLILLSISSLPAAFAQTPEVSA
jgi:hypothetical protein